MVYLLVKGLLYKILGEELITMGRGIYMYFINHNNNDVVSSPLKKKKNSF